MMLFILMIILAVFLARNTCFKVEPIIDPSIEIIKINPNPMIISSNSPPMSTTESPIIQKEKKNGLKDEPALPN